MKAAVFYTLVVWIIGLVSCQATKYTLVVPNQAYAGGMLQAMVSVYHSSPGTAQAVVTKMGTTTPLSSTGQLNVSPSGVATTFDVSMPADLTSGEYVVNVFNDIFNSSATFKLVSAPYSILIQTDKPIYKPSQTINFRVAIIDKHLRPRNETIDVVIEDADGNKIQQWRNVETSVGLKQLSLPLSDKPPLGEWKITVSTEKVVQEKTIKIDEYVLPRFEVRVDMPTYILKKATTFTCTVHAQYTFGEDVSGDLMVTFRSNDGKLDKTGMKIDGSAVVTLSLEDIQDIGLSSGLFTAEAFVTEPLSGKTLNGSASATIAVADYVVKYEEVNSKAYVFGQPTTYYFGVSKPDGQRVIGESNELSVTLNADGDSSISNTVTKPVPDSGIVAVTFTMPGRGYYSVHLTSKLLLASGEEVRGPTEYLSTFRTVNDEVYLRLVSDVTGVKQVGDMVRVTVSTSQQSGPFSYSVMSRGKSVASDTLQLSAGTGTFDLSLTQDFTPKVTIVVYAMVGEEVLADSVSFNVDGTFQNSVSLEFTDTSGNAIEVATPGSDIKVRVDTTAGSTVGLLSVDKSVLLLGGGNDITQSQILSELMSLVETDNDCTDDYVGPVFFFFPVFGGKSTEDVFSSAGLKISTNADLMQCFNDVPMFAMDAFPEAAMPPGAIPEIAESSAPVTAKPRKFFPETWLWDLEYSSSDSLTLDKTVPDTITSWVTTALSMHPQLGLTVTAQSTELTVKLPFFITPILPYSAVKGEELELKVIVNNYGDVDDSCTVTVAGSAQYEAKVSENDLYMPDTDLVLNPVSVSKGSAVAVVVWLRPSVIDTIQLSVSASCTTGASDAFQRDLLIKPPGYPQEKCESKFIQIETGGEAASHDFNIYIDGSYVTDSKTVKVMVTGDVIGPSIEGLDSLVRMPYGCGEQNMISFTPNIFVRAYLEHVGDLSADIQEKTTKYMQTGYQRELTYKHKDGSFSAFGESDPSGSTWLTAFVMKCFRQASLLIEIDLTVLQRSLSWLNEQKSDSGMFNEPGKVLHQEMQGGSSGGITLTAFVVIAMLEDVTGAELTSRINSLSSTVAYLEGKLSLVENNAYQLSIITYALQLANSGQVDSFLSKLEGLQQSEGGLVWWDKPEAEGKSRHQGGPSSVEMSSYALLTYVHRNDVNKAKPIAMWLTETRGSSGGYYSTQDTVLGLQSLAAYAKMVISDSTNLNVAFETNLADSFTHTITADNAIITKKHWFKPAKDISKVTVSISGVGSTIVTACTGYNIMSLADKPTTQVSTDITKPSNDSNKAHLKACVTFVGEGESGMGLTQIMLPTGYSAAVDDVVRKSGDLARAEAMAGGIAVYWNEMTSEQACVDVTLVRDAVVKEVQDSYVLGSQYYNTESGSRSFYNPEGAKVAPVIDDGDPSGAAAELVAAVATIAATLIIHLI